MTDRMSEDVKRFAAVCADDYNLKTLPPHDRVNVAYAFFLGAGYDRAAAKGFLRMVCCDREWAGGALIAKRTAR